MDKRRRNQPSWTLGFFETPLWREGQGTISKEEKGFPISLGPFKTPGLRTGFWARGGLFQGLLFLGDPSFGLKASLGGVPKPGVWFLGIPLTGFFLIFPRGIFGERAQGGSQNFPGGWNPPGKRNVWGFPKPQKKRGDVPDFGEKNRREGKKFPLFWGLSWDGGFSFFLLKGAPLGLLGATFPGSSTQGFPKIFLFFFPTRGVWGKGIPGDPFNSLGPLFLCNSGGKIPKGVPGVNTGPGGPFWGLPPRRKRLRGFQGFFGLSAFKLWVPPRSFFGNFRGPGFFFQGGSFLFWGAGQILSIFWAPCAPLGRPTRGASKSRGAGAPLVSHYGGLFRVWGNVPLVEGLVATTAGVTVGSTALASLQIGGGEIRGTFSGDASR